MAGLLDFIGTAGFTALSMWAAYRAQEDQRRTQMSLLQAQSSQAQEQISELEKARGMLSEIYKTKRGFVERTFRDRYASEAFSYLKSARTLNRKAFNRSPQSIRYNQADPMSEDIASRMELDTAYDITKRTLRTSYESSLFGLEEQKQREISSITEKIFEAQHRMNLYSMQLDQLRSY